MTFEVGFWHGVSLRQLDLMTCNQCGDTAEAQDCFTGLNPFYITSVVKPS